MHTKAMSSGVSLASCCASVTCSARTGTENSATSLAWVTRRPCFLMCSTCSGHGSMNVTSSPACTIWAPAYPPTAPAPTIAIFRPMLFSWHFWQSRLPRWMGSSQTVNRTAPGAKCYSLAMGGLGSFSDVGCAQPTSLLSPQERTSAARPITSKRCQYRKSPASLDHLVGATEQRERDGEAERLGGLEVYHHLDFHRPLDR